QILGEPVSHSGADAGHLQLARVERAAVVDGGKQRLEAMRLESRQRRSVAALHRRSRRARDRRHSWDTAASGSTWKRATMSGGMSIAFACPFGGRWTHTTVMDPVAMRLLPLSSSQV